MDQNKASTVLSSKEHNQLQTAKNRRKPDARDALIALDRARWAMLAFGLLFALMLSVYYVYSLSGLAQENFEVVYIKVFPDGSHQVTDISPESPQEFFQATLEKHLAEYIVHRWGQNPTTIREDYGRAILFMSPKVAGQFTGKEGFNASQKATDIIAEDNSEYIEIKIGAFDYYDSKTAVINREQQTIFKTNIYIERIFRDPLGVIRHREKNIVTLDWRLMTKKELLRKTKSFFRINAIGVEIVEQHLYDDLSSE